MDLKQHKVIIRIYSILVGALIHVVVIHFWKASIPLGHIFNTFIVGKLNTLAWITSGWSFVLSLVLLVKPFLVRNIISKALNISA